MTAAPISTTSTPQHAPAEVHPPRQPSTHCEGKTRINNEDTWAALYDNINYSPPILHAVQFAALSLRGLSII